MLRRFSLRPGLTPGAGGPAGTSRLTAPPGTLIIQPRDGPTPYLDLINGAGRQIDVNSYLLTDSKIVAALIARAEAGLTVRVVVAGNPYEDRRAPAAEREAFAGTPVEFRLAPPQFEAEYTFDHAKYIVVDPGTPEEACILGSSNLDQAGLGGGNREYAFQTADPAIVADLAAVFDADWAGRVIHPDQSGPLVISPGAEDRLAGIILGARARLYIESEELGDDRPVLDAVRAGLSRGVAVKLLLPARVSANDRRNAGELGRAGAAVRYLDHPYPHAKIIIADDRMFLGSQNISESSLNKNREVGIVLGGDPVNEALSTFEQDFASARA